MVPEDVLSDDNKITEAIPFSLAKQAAVLWHLGVDRVFFDQFSVALGPQCFTDALHGKICRALQGFVAKYHRLPSQQEWASSEGFALEEPQVRTSMLAALETAHNEARRYKLDVLRSEMTEWLHAYIYWEAHNRSAQLFKDHKYGEAYQIAKDAQRKIEHTKFDPDLSFNFNDIVGFVEEEQRLARTETVRFGVRAIDRELSGLEPWEGEGGLRKGDMTVLMAPVNIGKTLSMLNVAIENVMAAKRVLFLTHEGNERDIAQKLICRTLSVSKRALRELTTTDDGRHIIKTIQGLLTENLTYIHYTRFGMSLEEVASVIRRECEGAKVDGRPYDLICDDYPELLHTTRTQNVRMEDRNRIQESYLAFAQLASELNVHALVNAQTNREGSKVNRKQERLLSMEDVAESWGIAQKATNVISLNRDPNGGANGKIVYYINKSRSSRVGLAAVVECDLSRCITHSYHQPTYWYRGSTSYDISELTTMIQQSEDGELKPTII